MSCFGIKLERPMTHEQSSALFLTYNHWIIFLDSWFSVPNWLEIISLQLWIILCIHWLFHISTLYNTSWWALNNHMLKVAAVAAVAAIAAIAAAINFSIILFIIAVNLLLLSILPCFCLQFWCYFCCCFVASVIVFIITAADVFAIAAAIASAITATDAALLLWFLFLLLSTVFTVAASVSILLLSLLCSCCF